MTNFEPWSGGTGQDPYARYEPYGPYQPIQAYEQYQAPPPVKPARGRRVALSVGALAAAAALVTAGVGIGHATTTGGTATAQQPAVVTPGGNAGGSSVGGSIGSGSGSGQFPGLFPGGSSGSGSGSGSDSGTGGSSSASSTAATSTQQRGIVTIVSVLKYQNAESAGTGMILTSDGEILTNNHVVDGATSVTVTDESTGKSYRADVVGTDPSDDVAVLQLRNASGLGTAQVGDANDVSDLTVGAKVTGVGNAGGTGSLTQVSGAVTALEQSITASDESGASSEKLTGLIETDAAIVSGDSGGPLYDTDGDIVGINTAASTTNGNGGSAQSYTIPIDDALKIARQIESGLETSSVHIGLPAFIGVGVSATQGSGGAVISSVLEGGPADAAGITEGSTVTAVGGTAITDGDSLQTALGQVQPGAQVKISWTDTEGQQHTAGVTTVTGPAD